MSIANRIKAVFRHMLGRDQINRLFDIDNVSRSDKMEQALQLYADMRSGTPSWCTGDIRTIRMSNMICREIANLTTFNISVTIDGNDELQKKTDEVMNVIRQKQEECCSTAGMMVKSNGSGIEFLTPEYFLITDYDVTGNALAAIFFSWIKKKDTYFVRAEYHRFETVGGEKVYKISSKAYKTQDIDTMGELIPLSDVPEWGNIEPETEIRDLEYPLFVYWRTPYANTIDKDSPLCVPVFSEAIEELKDLDIAYSRNAEEIKDSSRIVLADDRLLMPGGTSTKSGRHRIVGNPDMPHYVKNVFGSGAADFYQEINPALNTQTRLTGIDALLSQIGYKCGFSNGYFVFDQKTGMVTATQVESDDRRTLETIKAFREILDGKNHNGVIHRIVYILYVIGLGNGEIPYSDYDVECFFGDMTANFEEDRARAYNLMIQGILPKWYYLNKYEGFTEDEAKSLIDEAGEAQEPEGLFGNE